MALASLDARKPMQVNLRRAVSSAYYAVFHYLVHESCCLVYGTQHAQTPYRNALGRAFVHGAMKQACASFGGGALKAAAIKGLPRDPRGEYAIATPIRDIARTFTDLQEKRHLADYDRSERFKRSDVRILIERAEAVVDDFGQLAMSDDKRFFLACLWAWKELTNR